VFQLAAYLALELLVDGHVLLEDGRHLAAELVVLAEHLLDVGRVEEHLHHLVEQVIERLVAGLDATLLRVELPQPGKLGLRHVVPADVVLRRLGGLLLGPEVALQHRGDVGLDLFRPLRLDVARGDQRSDHLGGDRADLAAEKTHPQTVFAPPRAGQRASREIAEDFSRPGTR
jgi:hypothetical protein